MFSPFNTTMISILSRMAPLLMIAAAPAVADATATTQPAPTTLGPATLPASEAASMGRWLSDLASSDSATRESARVQLMRLNRDDLPALEKWVEHARPLAPSQAVALRQIVQEVYLAGEEYEKKENQGFLGIMMDAASLSNRDLPRQNDHEAAPGVVVADRIPGFCASRMLVDGDVILGTTDPPHVFNSPADLQTVIVASDPGTIIHLQVLRHGQVIDVPLKLDCKPIEADGELATENFRLRRAEKFNDYWRASFAPLLKEIIG
jgi:hypothetical protein